MLDEVGQRIDHAGDDHWSSASGSVLQAAVLVRVARVGERQHEAADLRLLDGRQDLGERHVAVVRAFVVAPAGVQPHPLARHVGERVVDRAITRSTKPTNSPSGRSCQVMWRSIARSGAVDLQHEAMRDDGFVLHLERVPERGEIGVVGVVLAVAHRRGDDAGRGRGHERFGEAAGGRIERAPEVGAFGVDGARSR